MLGNVQQWCQDWYDDYPSGSVTDPTGPSSGSYRVFRGGSFGSSWMVYTSADSCRLAYRQSNDPKISGAMMGFRLVSQVK